MHRFRLFHPVTKIIFFAVLFGIAMFSENPVIRLLSLAGAIVALGVSGMPAKKLLKIIAGGIFTVLIMGPVNCIISHEGKTVLFKIFTMKITAEAFWFGLSAGTMIVGTAIWCIFLTDETDTEDLVFSLGRILPGISSVITVTLRYIPEIIKKFRETYTAQKMLGVFKDKKFFARAAISSKIFMSVTERSIENAMDTAATMRARGYGLRKRVPSGVRKWRNRDTLTVILCAICAGAFAAGEITGSFGFTFYPYTGFGAIGIPGVAMTVACAIFFMIPAGAEIKGRIRWQRSFE
ncbi:MAG: energy-coupling factor transporter transmembrane protein EcfT [Clostridia bacterium]|nr:energy-coupling factor transporter transmembrane protein EcfT [Clostridia bacterium]